MSRLRIVLAALPVAAAMSVAAPVASASGSCDIYPSGQRTEGFCTGTGRTHVLWTSCSGQYTLTALVHDGEWKFTGSCRWFEIVSSRGITWP